MKKLLLFALLVAAQHTFPVEWKGQWINSERCQSAKNTWLVYRKTVDVAVVPRSLEARIAVDSKYWLWINNTMVVFEGGLKRGPSPHGTYYDVADIAPYLTAGENLIAVLVWHFGQDGFSHTNSGKAALLFDAAAPGIEIVSDASWRCALYDAYQNTEAPFPNYRLPESNIRFDARKEMADWNLTTFKGSLPQAIPIAEAEGVPFGQLTERPVPLWKDYGLTPYPDIRQSGDTLICKLPYNCQLTPWLRVEAKSGLTIRMQTDNYRGGGANNIRAEYITREGVQEYESYGWMNGHEVWYIIPEGVKVLEVNYRETGYNAEFSGSFQCNDPFYNELWKRSARTLYVTMRDSYMDCPDRERSQWWGDEVNELGETFYALSPPAQQLAAKGIYELMNWQRKDGVIYSPVPAGNWDRELPLQMLASVGWYGFYTHYFYSADSAFVPVIYDRLHRYLHDVWKTDKSGLALERSGGWNWGDWGENIDIGVLTNCWYYLALKAQKAFAVQLGKQEDAACITRKMETIANCFDTRFWNGTAYRSPGYKGETDDRAQAMAVVSGLASEDKYPAIVNVLRKEYHASPYMEKYVLEALFRMNQPEFALQRMKERYAKMMAYPYTTLFEGWGVGDDGFGGGTVNHAWSGGPLTMLSAKVCGIEPTSPGFKTFKVAPQPGNLTEAEAVTDTRFGKITVKIKKSGSRLRIQLTVPEGTSAEVVSPKGKKQQVTAGTHSLVFP
jgi:hypothetical protein